MGYLWVKRWQSQSTLPETCSQSLGNREYRIMSLISKQTADRIIICGDDVIKAV